LRKKARNSRIRRKIKAKRQEVVEDKSLREKKRKIDYLVRKKSEKLAAREQSD
jgi:hypothetical protein